MTIQRSAGRSRAIRSHNLRLRIFAGADEFLADFDTARPGCLLLDLRMPGMTGEELLRTLRQRGVNVPVIIMTGHGDVPVAVSNTQPNE